VLTELNILDIDTAALAKSRVFAAAGDIEVSRSAERVFRPGRKNPIVLRQNSKPLLLLARIRDEAHRFAVTYHKLIRNKATLTSGLEEIPGVGHRLSTRLLQEFGSLAKVKAATVDELATIPGVSAKLAQTISEHLAQGRNPQRH
jgi:excinuclease ABC subunit C